MMMKSSEVITASSFEYNSKYIDMLTYKHLLVDNHIPLILTIFFTIGEEK